MTFPDAKIPSDWAFHRSRHEAFAAHMSCVDFGPRRVEYEQWGPI